GPRIDLRAARQARAARRADRSGFHGLRMPQRICDRLRDGSCASLPRASVRGAHSADAVADLAPRQLDCAKESTMARILLADNDAATRDLVQRALATDGHSVTPTQDGAEAL